MTDRWGQVAGDYLSSQWHSSDEALQKLVAMVEPEGGLVLDIGTGAGHTAFAFAPYVDAAIAFDSSQGMLDVAAQEADRRGLRNFETKLGDAHDLPYSEGQLDGIACRCAAHHFRDVHKFAREVFRALKPGGWFLLVDTIGIEDSEADDKLDQFERWRDPTHVRNLTESAWREIGSDVGLSFVKSEAYSKPLNVKDWLDRQRTPEPERTNCIRTILESSGDLKSYLNWTGTGDDLTFHLREAAMLFRKP
ncbi:MAG: class I SAM-dependent methyltransferase [Fimbriimonadales bacterium]